MKKAYISGLTGRQGRRCGWAALRSCTLQNQLSSELFTPAAGRQRGGRSPAFISREEEDAQCAAQLTDREEMLTKPSSSPDLSTDAGTTPPI